MRSIVSANFQMKSFYFCPFVSFFFCDENIFLFGFFRRTLMTRNVVIFSSVFCLPFQLNRELIEALVFINNMERKKIRNLEKRIDQTTIRNGIPEKNDIPINELREFFLSRISLSSLF